MNSLVQYDLNILEIMIIIRMIWIINLKNMTMIDMQSQKSKEMLLTYLMILTQILRQILQ